jgi:hypothetical protein
MSAAVASSDADHDARTDGNEAGHDDAEDDTLAPSTALPAATFRPG